MYQITELSISELLSPEGYRCSCGRIHKAGVKKALIGENVIEQVPELIRTNAGNKPYIIADRNTMRAAGDKLLSLLEKASVPYRLFVFPQEEIEPNEFAVGQLAMNYDSSCDFLIGIGSGCINDICKVFNKSARLPYMIVGTAPSMDGYASNSGAMIVAGVKTSVYTAAPDLIVADTIIMKDAPEIMLASGFGDMMAKYVALGEWKISNLVTGEYYCPEIAALVERSVKKCVENAEGLRNRDPGAVHAVVEGLILSGIAMSYAGISRPASGLEHYFSHIWEMHSIEGKAPRSLHGIQCGIGTVLTLKLYEWAKKQSFSPEKAEAVIENFNRTEWEAFIRKVFGPTAEKVLEIDRQTGKSTKETFDRHLQSIILHQDELYEIMETGFPSSEFMEKLLRTVKAPTMPSEIGIDEEETVTAFYASKEIRDKYIGSRFFWELGLFDEAADELKRLLK